MHAICKGLSMVNDLRRSILLDRSRLPMFFPRPIEIDWRRSVGGDRSRSIGIDRIKKKFLKNSKKILEKSRKIEKLMSPINYLIKF